MVYSPLQILQAFRNWFITQSGFRWGESRRNWTPEIKGFFGQLGQRDGFFPIYTRRRPRQSEYLVDLVWKVERPRRYLELALESELSGKRGEIMKDFEKLLDIKANIKVGLFQLNSDIGQDVIQKMQDKLLEQAYPISSEKYLIILLRYLENQGEVEICGFELSVTGRAEEIERNSYTFAN